MVNITYSHCSFLMAELDSNAMDSVSSSMHVCMLAMRILCSIRFDNHAICIIARCHIRIATDNYSYICMDNLHGHHVYIISDQTRKNPGLYPCMRNWCTLLSTQFSITFAKIFIEWLLSCSTIVLLCQSSCMHTPVYHYKEYLSYFKLLSSIGYNIA